jgi:uncharacterized protein (DUF305 family)
MNKEIFYGIIGLLVGIFITIVVASNAVNNNNTSIMRMMGFGNMQGFNQKSEALDAHFIEQMIPHHEDAITMAKIAQTKAKKQEIKQLANNIIDSQSKEINKMKMWYRDWYGKDVPTDSDVMNQHGMMGGSTMHMGMMDDETDMTRLEQADDFDKAFIEEMIPHHQMAVMMASMLKDGTQRPEMKKLAEDIISAQTKEIDEMRGWYNEWK